MKKTNAAPEAVLTAAVFIIILGVCFLLNRMITPPAISQSERRPLATFPELSAASVFSAEFMGNFENFAADSFVMRDGLRTVRAVAVFDIFWQTDKGGLYYGNDGAGKFEKIDEDSVKKTAAKIRKIAGGLEGLNIFYSFIPDKSTYAGRLLPGFESETARRILAEELSGLAFVDLTDVLEANDYYRTDLHWDQSRLYGVLDAFGTAMGFTDRLNTAFIENHPGTFQGAYSGQLALPMEPDQMTYLTNGILDKAVVQYLDPMTGGMEQGVMYDTELFAGRDPYDLFLKGAQPLIVIDNPTAETDRELYLFRDSFSSSLAPLLTSAYKRVTLIDLRYIDSRTLPEYVQFHPGSDALFLYGSQILNSPEVLLVN
jgi:hypothetical protein